MAVEAAAVNFPDLLLCLGTYHHKPESPFVLGCEAAGTVVTAGPGVGLRPGQRVLAAPLTYGCFADTVRTTADAVFPVPDSMTSGHAAALFMAYQTSWVGLHRRAALRADEVLVVHGASGGVGSAAVQIGKALGATVVATAGGADKAAVCRQLGADRVVDHTQEDFVTAVKELTNGRGADVIYDPVGGSVFDRSTRCIAVEGRILVVGFASGDLPKLAVNHALMKNYSVVGFRLQPFRENRAAAMEAHQNLLRLHAQGAIAPLISDELPMSDAPKAIARLGERGVVGRLLLRN